MTASPEAFEAYFRMADTDNDGRISGAEAVAFLQGSGLPQVILAKVWQFADSSHTGFLSRVEFYNALKLVTVAQSGRDLTPELVRSALGGPAASQIPAPKIITSVLSQSGAALASSLVGVSNRALPQQSQVPNLEGKQGFSRPGTPNDASLMRLAGITPTVPDASRASLFGSLGLDAWVKPATPTIQAGSSGSSMTALKQEAKAQVPVTSVGLQDLFTDGEFKATPPVASVATPLASGANNVSQGNTGGNISASSTAPSSASPLHTSTSAGNTTFGFHAFTAFNVKPSSSPQVAQVSQAMASPPTGLEVDEQSSRGKPAAVKAHSVMVAPSPAPTPSMQPVVPAQRPMRSSVPLSPRDFGGALHQVSNVLVPWPQMTHIELQRYSAMFGQLDIDRDGKITGTQARELFLGWRLPVEMLKQVWDLADQDADGMLSQKEFCMALYFIERFREGRPLPAAAPTGIYFEDPSLQVPAGLLGQVPVPSQAAAGFQNTAARLQGHGASSGVTASVSTHQSQSRVPVLDPFLVGELSRDEQEMVSAKHQEAEQAEKKVLDADKDATSTKQKIDYYRTKLQELVLFKSRSDNQLMDIMERAAADNRELELLTRNFNEKVEQLNQANSQLVGQNDAFQDIQRRKAEVSDAIAKLEQGEVKGLLQTRADRLWNDLDELKKSLSARYQQLGLRLPSVYDEHWDKFNDDAGPAKNITVTKHPHVSSVAPKVSAEHSHHDVVSKTQPLGKSNLGTSGAASRRLDLQGVFSEAEPFDWRTAHHEERERDADPRSEGSTHSKLPSFQDYRDGRQSSRFPEQIHIFSEAGNSRGREKFQQRKQDHHSGFPSMGVDKSGMLHKGTAAQDSPLFSSSPEHPKLSSGSEPRQESELHAARYDDDPFAGMGPFGGN